MNPQDPLAQLQPLRQPDVIGWWPPAPGWWLLLLLAVLAIAGLIWWRRRLRQPPLARLSMRELSRIRRDYRAGSVTPRVAVDSLARLLRRILIGYRGRDTAAATTGDGWLAQLEELSPRQAFSAGQLQWLARDRYRPGAECDVDALLAACEDWMRSLPKDTRHVPD